MLSLRNKLIAACFCGMITILVLRPEIDNVVTIIDAIEVVSGRDV